MSRGKLRGNILDVFEKTVIGLDVTRAVDRKVYGLWIGFPTPAYGGCCYYMHSEVCLEADAFARQRWLAFMEADRSGTGKGL